MTCPVCGKEDCVGEWMESAGIIDPEVMGERMKDAKIYVPQQPVRPSRGKAGYRGGPNVVVFDPAKPPIVEPGIVGTAKSIVRGVTGKKPK